MNLVAGGRKVLVITFELGLHSGILKEVELEGSFAMLQKYQWVLGMESEGSGSSKRFSQCMD